ncbi:MULTISPECIES: GYD domain-containing protein [unclassified Haladaptatus]|uniref:GYD domain-containing protein n=1 Tax=unclassified Haladaptatus TaxID=2622732 RepID=UPI0023E858CA|nr:MULTISPECIES: GYD domain-containing protein [unclassified Haladaptatus]
MPKFAVLAKRTEKGRTITPDENKERRRIGTEMIHDVGGEIDTLYYGTGPYHFVLIVDLPDAAALAKLQIAYESLGLMEIEGYEVFDPAHWDEILEGAPSKSM